MDQVTGMDHLDTMSEGELDVLERQIAGRYMNIVP